MVNVEELLIAEINRVRGAGFAVADVPEQRPVSFVTVELTGGPSGLHLSRPTVAVQCWAPDRAKASDLAYEIAGILKSLATHPNIGRVDVQSIYNFPDPDSGQPRYQLTVSLVTKD